MQDKELYLLASTEAENGGRDEALWAKAAALTAGDAEKAKYKYIELRVAELLAGNLPEIPTAKQPNEAGVDAIASKNTGSLDESPALGEADEFFSRLWRGLHGLPATFWVFGVSVDALVWVVGQVIAAQSASLGDGAKLLIFCFGAAYAGYRELVCVGIWNAASRDTGWVGWKFLAKVFAVLWGAAAAVYFVLFTAAVFSS